MLDWRYDALSSRHQSQSQYLLSEWAIFYSYRSLNKAQFIIYTNWYLQQLRLEVKMPPYLRKVKAMSCFKLTSYDQWQNTIIWEITFTSWSNAIILYAIEFGRSERKLLPLLYWCSHLMCSHKSSVNRWIKILTVPLPLPS